MLQPYDLNPPAKHIQDNLHRVFIRGNMALLELSDLDQSFTVEADLYLCFRVRDSQDIPEFKKRDGVKFYNLPNYTGWFPHIDFDNEIHPVRQTDKSVWCDPNREWIFARVCIIPQLQGRLNHSDFPFDRQVLPVELLSNNCLLYRWVDQSIMGAASGDSEPSIPDVDDDSKQIESMAPARNYDSPLCASFQACADTWWLAQVEYCIKRYGNEESSTLKVYICLQRRSAYFLWNIVFVLFIINAGQLALFLFPYDTSRFEHLLTLTLTISAFKFVAHQQVPRMAYQTIMDKYMLLGFIIVGVRFVGDLLIQCIMQTPVFLTFSAEVFNPALAVDLILTASLGILNVVYSIYFMFFAEARLHNKSSNQWEALIAFRTGEAKGLSRSVERTKEIRLCGDVRKPVGDNITVVKVNKKC